ncbi:GNAT family N-acetyltransferase, partial [Roseibium sp.]
MKTTSDQPAIRRAEMQDAAAVKSCIDRAYAPVKSKIDDLPDVSAGVEEDIASNVVFVAETGAGIAGCAILGLASGSAHLSNVAVDPAFKGLGLGKALIGTAETHARNNGAREIHLAT